MSAKIYSTGASADGSVVLTEAGVAHRGKLHAMLVINNTAATLHVQVFDANALPSAGAHPILELQVPAGTQSSLDLDKDTKDLNFVNGLTIACSSTTWSYTSVAAAMFLTCWYEVQ